MTWTVSPRAVSVFVGLLALGCGPEDAEEGGESNTQSESESESESGSGDGDGDATAGDGDGDATGDGDASGDGDGDASGDGDGDASGDGDGDATAGDGDGDGDAFTQLCMAGCAHVLECAPDAWAELYADLPACLDNCISLWGGCADEGTTYIECTLGLECAEVVILLGEGPAQTVCSDSFDAAQNACG